MLRNWLIAQGEPNGSYGDAWWIPGDAQSAARHMEPTGTRSDSIAYARTIIPLDTRTFTIEFEYRGDLPSVIWGATQPSLQHDGVEHTLQVEAAERFAGRGWRRVHVEVSPSQTRFLSEDAEFTHDHAKRLVTGYVGFKATGASCAIRHVRITVERPTMPKRPNVLFIAIDDLRNDLGCYGSEHIASPHLDAFAERGVTFERAYCQYPLCNPSRASVLTGQRPRATGVDRNELNNTFHFREKLPDAVTLPQHFQRYGYHVGRIGKLYHYGVPREIGTESALDDRASWHFAKYPRGGEKDEEGDLISYTPKRSSGWALSWQESQTPANMHTDGKVATQAIDYIQATQRQPFFLALGFYRPHVPSTAPPEFFTHYPVENVLLPKEPEAHFSLIPKAAFDGHLQVNAAREDLRLFKRAYYATVSLVDHQIGRVLTALEESPQADNTIVVIWSDHGWMLGEHNQWEKRVLFEESVRVPLLIYAPGLSGMGQRCARVVELVDLYPTLVELCGLKPPHALAGRSLVPLLDNPKDSWPDIAFSEVRRTYAEGHSVRTPRWRYTEWNGGQAGRELYDHDSDPHELQNLAADPTPSHSQVIEELSAHLQPMRDTATQ